MHKLLENQIEKPQLLLGNEAIVRGVLEGGARVAAAYPGTPSSEISNNLFQITQDDPQRIYFEFSVNEKVAMEIAAAAAAAGVRSATFMKHVGLNVASDVYMTLAYLGVKAGMLIVCADDPSAHSSQNEQDNRYYAQMAGIPVLEPTSPQEALEMTKAAFLLSEQLELPVILRTTTRTAHVRSVVNCGQLPELEAKKGVFTKEMRRWVAIPATARARHKALLEAGKKALELSEASPYNTVNGSGSVGIIASGVSASYVEDAIEDLACADTVTFFRLGFSYPQPRKKLVEFLKKVDKVLVVEELEPFQENTVKVIAQENGLCLPVFGKTSGHLPLCYEFTPKMVREAICAVMGIEDSFSKQSVQLPDISQLPIRPPSMCKGCPHAESYGLVKQAVKELGYEENVLYPTDIGCYTLGALPPFSMADYLLCMGSSVGTSCGFSTATDHKIVSFIGDSTFFHSGIAPLINAVHQRHNFCLVILDNFTTAMTGHQPHPGIPDMPAKKETYRVSIEEVVKGCGVQHLFKINPNKKETALETVKEALKIEKGPVVIISESPCILNLKKTGGKS